MIINWFKSLFRKKPIAATHVEERHRRVNSGTSNPIVMGVGSLTGGIVSPTQCDSEPYQITLLPHEKLSAKLKARLAEDKECVIGMRGAEVAVTPAELTRRREQRVKQLIEASSRTTPAVSTINTHATPDTVALFPHLHSSTSHVSPSCRRPAENVSSSSYSSDSSSCSSSSSSSFD